MDDSSRTMRGRTIKRYLCRHEGVDGVRTHDEHATGRYRVGTDGRRWPLCAEHAAQWRTLGLLASSPGPTEPTPRDLPSSTFPGWAD